MKDAASPAADAQRIDKWLWAARFFKTRTLAAEAVAGGKVQVDGERVKPGRRIRAGARLEIRRGEQRWDVEVLAVAARRGPAREAATLYRETDESRERRTSEAERARQRAARRVRGLGRPTKRDRRDLERLLGDRQRDTDDPAFDTEPSG